MAACTWPECRNATAGDAELCSTHATYESQED